MITPANALFQLFTVEQFCVSIEDMPAEPALRDPSVFYAISGTKMPDFLDCPNHFIAILDMDYVQAEMSRYISDGVSSDQANVKISVRTTDYIAGSEKIHHLARTLDTLDNYVIAVPSDNRGEFDARNNIPRSAEKRVIAKCSRLETIRDRGLDGTLRRYLFEVVYTVRFL